MYNSQISVKQSYDPYFDNLKAVLIFLVVLGHFLEIRVNQSAAARIVFSVIYVFHMPLFIFVSGYFSKSGISHDKLLKNLLIPYLVFNSLWYLLAIAFIPGMTFRWFYPGMSLWYLLSLFIWRMLLPYLTQIRFILPLSLLAGLLAGCFGEFGFFLSASRTVFFLPLFLAGYYCTKEQLNSWKIKMLPAVAVIITVAALLYLLPVVWPVFKPGFFYADNSYTAVKISIWTGMLFRAGFYFLAFVMSVAVISLIPSGEKKMTFIGRKSLLIYIFHTFAVFIFKNQVSRLEEWFVLTAIWLLPLILTPLLTMNFFAGIYNCLVNPLSKILIKWV